MYKNKDCPHNDIIPASDASTPKQCADICEVTEGCVAFLFNRNTAPVTNCFIKTECIPVDDVVGANGYRRGNAIFLRLFFLGCF